MPARFRSRPFEGEYVAYDGTNGGEIAGFAGGQHEGPSPSGHPRVRSRDGDVHELRPGWVLSRADGADGVTVSSPRAWAELAGEAA